MEAHNSGDMNTESSLCLIGEVEISSRLLVSTVQMHASIGLECLHCYKSVFYLDYNSIK